MGLTPATTDLELIHLACDEIDNLHPPATLTGDRTRHLTRRIRDAATDQDQAVTRVYNLLETDTDKDA